MQSIIKIILAILLGKYPTKFNFSYPKNVVYAAGLSWLIKPSNTSIEKTPRIVPNVTIQNTNVLNMRSFSSSSNIPKKTTPLTTVEKSSGFFTDKIKPSLLNEAHSKVPLDSLKSSNSVALVPLSKFCPPWMPMQQFSEHVSLSTALTCYKEGMNLNDIIPLHNLARGYAGQNINNLVSVRPSIPMLKKIISYKHHFAATDLKALPETLVFDLNHISLKKMAMIPYEIYSMLFINNNLNEHYLILLMKHP